MTTSIDHDDTNLLDIIMFRNIVWALMIHLVFDIVCTSLESSGKRSVCVVYSKDFSSFSEETDVWVKLTLERSWSLIRSSWMII